MLGSIHSILADLFRTFRLADLFDIALVAGFLFLVLTWLQQIASRQTSRSLLSIAVVFATIYLLARFFEMYLAEALIEVLLIIFVITTIVVFQAELRRLIHRLGSWRIFRPSTSTPPSATIDLLTKAVAKLADTQTGALIALRGREPWAHLIQGGIPLDGTVSEPLLRSLFNPSAPGHDGAVLLEGNRVVKFAAHLPLATHLPAASRNGGTRHAAALGLAEQCDALVIVVSEERGSVSVAHRGQLTPLESVSALKDRLTAFWQKHYDTASHDRPAWWRRRMPRTAMLSLVLATMLWLVFAYRPDTVYRAFTVPIELRNLEETEWALRDPVPPSEADVTLAGPDLAFESLDPSTLVISLNADEAREGLNEFVIRDDNLPLPANLRLYQVDPASVTLRLERVRAMNVPVEVITAGRLPDSLALAGVQPDPDTVEVLVPRDVNETPTAVPTYPIELDSITGPSVIETELDLPEAVRMAPDAASTVNVRVEVRRAQ